MLFLIFLSLYIIVIPFDSDLNTAQLLWRRINFNGS